MTEVDFDFSSLSKIQTERVSVEDDKLVETDYHNPPYTLPKPTPTDKKSVRRRTSRTKTKKTQILEEKAGVEIDKILEEIAKDPEISSWKRQELTPDEFVEYAKRLLQYQEQGKLDFFICDLETQQLKWYHDGASLMGFALCDPIERTGYFVGYRHPELEITEDQQEMILKWVVRLFESIPYVNHNTKFDLSWMVSHTDLNIRKVEVLSDTMFQCSLYIGRDKLEAGEKFRLKDMSRRVLGFDFEWEKYLDDAMKSIRLRINRTFWNIKYKLVSIYAQFDGITTLLLYEAMKPKIQEAGMQKVLKLLTDSVITFVEIETAGVYVDTDLRQTLLEDYKGKMENIAKAFSSFPIIKEWEENNDEDFLITSTEKLAEVFFTPKYLALEPIETTKKGNPSTNKDVLEEIAAAKDPDFRTERKMAQLILDYRSVHKLESTYLSNLEKDLNGHIFYPDYNLLGARTGRISSYFHTIPKGNDIKRMFVSRFQENGGLILSGDYSQLEVRVIAGLAQDKNLREAYQSGYDVHRFTASKVFEKPMEKVSSGERGYAKTIVFGILYGKAIYSLSQELGITQEEAQELQDFFFKGFPKVKEWVDRQHQFVRDHKYVETAWGRRRYIPWIDDSREWMVEDAFRKAQNSPIQGTASDITLFATNLMQDQTHEKDLRSMIIGTVHDSIESDTHPEELFEMLNIMQYCSETYPNENFEFMHGVPLKFDYEIGTSWGGAVDIDEFKTNKHWRIAGFEKDIEALEEQLQKNYEVTLSDFEDSKADSDVIFRTINPGKRISCDIIIK